MPKQLGVITSIFSTNYLKSNVSVPNLCWLHGLKCISVQTEDPLRILLRQLREKNNYKRHFFCRFIPTEVIRMLPLLYLQCLNTLITVPEATAMYRDSAHYIHYTYMCCVTVHYRKSMLQS